MSFEVGMHYPICDVVHDWLAADLSSTAGPRR